MSQANATILIVDDEIKNRKLLEMLLQHEGYRTVCAEDGEQALASIAQSAPDLILLDVMMPGLDGYEVARILKTSPESLHIPIIMVSAHGDRTARLAGLNAGVDEFLTKPIDRDELWLRVRNMLRLKADADLIRADSAVLDERVKARTIDLQRFRTAMDATADVLTLVDRASMRYIEVNAAACTLSGYTREELLSLGPSQLLEVEVEDLERAFDAIIAGNASVEPQESMLRRKDGTQVCVEVNRQALQTDEGWTIVAVGRDITDRKDAEAKLQQLAHYDPLTRLPNRRLFQESLLKAMEQADALELQVVLLYLDLDNFKDVNDSLGHSVGDELLREVGERLLASLYARDSVGRLGGDEFGIILLTPRDPEFGMTVADKIHGLLRVPFELTGHSVRTSASIGISVYPIDTDNAGAMARFADMAMYEAKRSGRNASRFYTDAMNQRVADKLQLLEALRGALARDEFVLFYQPKISLRTGRWTGVEALLRWQRPGHGLIPPNSFIPALEESGLIVAVGAWIITTACKQLADWQRRGLGRLPIAVNVSALQIAHRYGCTVENHPVAAETALDKIELLSAVAACMAVHESAAGLLEVEITESAVMANADHSIEILRRLREMGVGLSVDDFGTGYSSLSYLRRFPLDAVKIDGSFIRDVTTNAEDASITVTIIEMAHRLKLKVIAECVETEEQMHFLQTHQCDEAQGYFFARPLPVAELETLWQQSSGEDSRVINVPVNAPGGQVLAPAGLECLAFEIGVQQVVVSEASLEEVARPLLQLAHLLTGMETTFVTSIDWDEQEQEVLLSLNTREMKLPEGSKVDWADSMCRSMFLSGRTSTTDVGIEVPSTSGASALGMKSFFAVPILVDDNPIGTVCGASRDCIELTGLQMDSMQLIANVLQHAVRSEVARSKAVLAAKAAQNDATEARCEAQAHAGHAVDMEALAHTDHLTNLPNRRAFVTGWEDALARSGRRAHPIGLLMIDVDHFKSVNDSMGHGVGDRVLQAVALALTDATVSGNVVGRLGGDEFAVAITHIDGQGLVATANHLCSVFNQALEQLGVHATLTIGAVSSDDCPRGEMFSRGDMALYLGKQAGRDQVWLFNPKTDYAGEVFAERRM